jgi:hypothetical protein
MPLQWYLGCHPQDIQYVIITEGLCNPWSQGRRAQYGPVLLEQYLGLDQRTSTVKNNLFLTLTLLAAEPRTATVSAAPPVQRPRSSACASVACLGLLRLRRLWSAAPSISALASVAHLRAHHRRLAPHVVLASANRSTPHAPLLTVVRPCSGSGVTLSPSLFLEVEPCVFLVLGSAIIMAINLFSFFRFYSLYDSWM